jgi:hypothetical protein
MVVVLAEADVSYFERELETAPAAGLSALWARICPTWETAPAGSVRPADYGLERPVWDRLVSAIGRGGGFLLWLNLGPACAEVTL